MNLRKRFAKSMSSPQNVRFGDSVAIVQAFGFKAARTSGGHHIFNSAGVAEQIISKVFAAKQSRTKSVSF